MYGMPAYLMPGAAGLIPTPSLPILNQDIMNQQLLHQMQMLSFYQSHLYQKKLLAENENRERMQVRTPDPTQPPSCTACLRYLNFNFAVKLSNSSLNCKGIKSHPVTRFVLALPFQMISKCDIDLDGVVDIFLQTCHHSSSPSCYFNLSLGNFFGFFNYQPYSSNI